MKILIITQKVDVDDDILGFFHGWLEKFSEKFDLLSVICLQSGRYSLSKNVKVFTLGKERGRSRTKSLYRFYKHIWRLRKNHDAVFVHMNPIYVVLAGIFWKIWGKKIYLWHNHKQGTLITRLAISLSDAVFYTSPHSFSAKFKKSRIMPVGIDTEMFRCQMSNVLDQKGTPRRVACQMSILYLGRFSPVKNVDILIEAAELLDKKGADFILNIVGRPGDGEEEYFKKIKNMAQDLEAKGRIRFLGKVANYQAPEIYNKNGVFVNLTQKGSFDKTILEAMACQSLILVSNPLFRELLSEELRQILIFEERNVGDLAGKIGYLLNMPDEQKEKIGGQLREIVVREHGLDNLIQKICANFGI